MVYCVNKNERSKDSTKDLSQLPSTQSFEEKSQKKKSRVTRRPSTNAAYIPSLRILRRDVRRKYVDMVNNIYNNYTAKFLSEFCHTFMNPNFRYADTVSQEIHSQSAFRSVYVQGVTRFITSIAVPFYMLPDLIFRLHSVQVCKRSNEVGSRVISKVSLRGTLLYIPQVPINSVNVDNKGTVDQIQFELQLNPETINFEGMCIMHLDENHHIRVFEFVMEKYLK